MLKKYFLVFGLFVLLLFAGCVGSNTTQNVSTQNNNFSEVTAPVSTPYVKNDTTKKPESQKLEIPKDSIALFYSTGISSMSDSINVFEGDGTIHTVKLDSSSRAMIMYLPELSVAKTMKTYTSQSYSQNMVYPYVSGGKFFVLRDWGSDWEIKNDRWTLEEFDTSTGKLVSTSEFQGSGFAVVGNKIYFNKNKKLNVINIGGNGYYSDELQSSYVGKIYGVGNNLVSLFVEGTKGQYSFSIRTHNLNTGAVEKTWYSGVGYDLTKDELYPGETAIYQVVSEGSLREIYIYPINGNPSKLLEFQLSNDETDIYVAEDNGYLAILIEESTNKGTKIKEMVLYHLATGAEETISLEPFTAPSSYKSIGAAFLLTK